MKALVIYDSANGNTEKIAQSIGSAISGEVKVVRTTEANLSELGSQDWLFIGSPTYGGRPTPPMLEFMSKIPESSIKGMKVATFDTRLTSKLVRIFGFAAGKIADNLKTRNGAQVMASEGFFVKTAKGPLVEGEVERAANWVKRVFESQKAATAAK